MVDEGDGPVAGSGEGAQPLDLRGDGVTLVARLVHVEQVVVELDPHVSPQGVQRLQRVGAQPLGAARVEPDEGGLLELEPTDHLECAGIRTHRAGPVLRRRSPLPAPIEDLPRTRRRKSLTGDEAFEVPGIHIDLGRLDVGEVSGPVDPVVVQESTTDDVPLVDDRAVDLEHHQQPVCRMGGSNVGVVPGQLQHPVPTSGHRRDRTEAL